MEKVNRISPTGKEIARTAGIVLASALGLYLLCLGALSIYIGTRKPRLLAEMNGILDGQVVGKVAIGGFDVSVWRSFPKIELRLMDVSISDTLYHLPMISAKSVSTTLGIFQLLGKNKTIRDVTVREGQVHLFTDSSGYNNNYLFQPKKKPARKEAAGEKGRVLISKITLDHLSVTIDDQPANKKIAMVIEDLRADLDEEDSLVHIKMQEKIRMTTGLGFNLAKGSYFENCTLAGNWSIQLNPRSKLLSFGNTVSINNHPYSLKGYFDLSPARQFSIAFDTRGEDYAKAVSILTAAIRKKIGVIRMKMPLDVNGLIEGSMRPHQEPFVSVHWSTSNNVLEVPALAFSDCGFSGTFMNEVNKDSARGDPNSRITVRNFSGTMGGIRLRGDSIVITNLANATIQFHLHSNASLEALDQNFSLEDIRFISGAVDLELIYNGPLGKDNLMVGDLEGVFHIQDGSLEYIPYNFLFTGANGDIAFLKDSVSIRKFTCTYKTNQFHVEGSATNVRRKLIGKQDDAAALVSMSVYTPSINLDDFDVLFGKKISRPRAKKAKANFSRTAAKLDAMMAQSVIGLSLRADHVRRGPLDASGLKAEILFQQGLWEIPVFTLGMAGGSINLQGRLRKMGADLHQASVGVSIDKVDIQRLFHAFHNFGQRSIQSNNLQGQASIRTKLTTNINGRGELMPESTRSTIDFSIRNGALVNFAPLAEIKHFALKDRDLHNIRFAELKDRLEVEGKLVYVHRMEIASTALHMYVQGLYDMKGYQTDLLLQVPFSNLGSPDKSAGPKNKGLQAHAGPGVLLRAKGGEDGKVKLGVTFSRKTKNLK